MDKNRKWITPRITDGSITPERIIDFVAGYFNLNKLDMAVNQKRKFCVPRQICMALMYSYLGMTLNEIAAEFDCPSRVSLPKHTTVRHSIKQVCDLAESDPKFKQDLAYIMAELENPTPVRRMPKIDRVAVPVTIYRSQAPIRLRERTISEHEKVVRKYL